MARYIRFFFASNTDADGSVSHCCRPHCAVGQRCWRLTHFLPPFHFDNLKQGEILQRPPLARYCRGPRQLPERFNFILLRVTPQVSEMRSWGFLCYSSSFLRHWRFSSFACSIPITHVKHKGLCAKIRLSFLSFKWLLETFWP